MDFVIIGLGSMGKRRIRLLLENFNGVGIIGIDSNECRRKQLEDSYNIRTYGSLDEALKFEQPSASFICTSPISHASLITKCLEFGMHVFTELNLLRDNYNDIMGKAQSKGLKLFLSSTFLYRKEINFIQSELNKLHKKVNYRYHVGQYLPDWHPWESYKDFFVANKRTNGCREIMAIEFPWIIKTFGKIDKVFSLSNKITTLDINYDDNYTIVIQHRNGNMGTINIDIASRKSIRSLEVYNEDIYLTWEGTPETLSLYDINQKIVKKINTYEDIERDARYSSNIIENAYLKEIEVFFDYLLNNRTDEIKYTFEEDLYTLSIIDEIEGVK